MSNMLNKSKQHIVGSAMVLLTSCTPASNKTGVCEYINPVEKNFSKYEECLRTAINRSATKMVERNVIISSGFLSIGISKNDREYFLREDKNYSILIYIDKNVENREFDIAILSKDK